LAIFVREIAIAFAIVMCVVAGYNIRKRYVDKQEWKQAKQCLYHEMDDNEGTKQSSTGEVAVSDTTAVNGAGDKVITSV
jgi:hypothetical protein